MEKTLQKEPTEKEKAHVGYFDESSALERRLNAIAELCRGCSDPERASAEVLEEVGNIIKNYLDSKLVLDHFFFERPIDEDSFDDLFLKAELYKLDERHSNI